MDTLFTIVSVLMSSALFVGIVIATINFILGKNVLAKHAPVENNSEITDENETNCFGNAQNDEIIDKAEYVKPATPGERKLFGIPLKTALVVLGTAIASRLITYIIAAIVSETYLFSETFFVRWDANHYLNLAKLGIYRELQLRNGRSDIFGFLSALSFACKTLFAYNFRQLLRSCADYIKYGFCCRRRIPL